MENRLEELRQAALEQEAMKREREERAKRTAEKIDKYKLAVFTAFAGVIIGWLLKQIQ